MKTTKLTYKLLPLITIFLAIVFAAKPTAKAGLVTITDVVIEPIVPTESEPITINTFAEVDVVGYPDMTFVGTAFDQSGTSLTLNIDFDEWGVYGDLILDPSWAFSEPIGRLAPDVYDLTVRAWIYKGDTLWVELSDEYSMSFQVIPEPTTLLFLGFGGLTLLRKHRTK